MENSARPRRLGIDVGGVVIRRSDTGDDTSFFSDDFLATPATGGCFDAIRSLSHELFGRELYIVSKCGPHVEEKTRRWLQHHRFFDRTGLPAEHLRFVRTPADKAPICEELAITHFIDDRLDVLESMRTVEHRLLFLGGGRPAGRTPPRGVTAVSTWDDVKALLLGRHGAAG